MKLTDSQILRLAESILNDLTADSLIQFKGDRGGVLEIIVSTIRQDQTAERALEQEAERLLEKTLRATGDRGDIDRHKMLRMIKEKLARERRFIL